MGIEKDTCIINQMGDPKFPASESTERQSFDEWVSTHKIEANSLDIPERYIRSLVPDRAFSIAENPNNVDLVLRESGGGALSLMVVERGYQQKLTDEVAWQKWQSDTNVALREQEGKRLKVLPPAPQGVDRLHAKFRNDVRAGTLSLKDRILFVLKLSVKMDAPNTLYVADYDGEIGKGIASEFYKKTLPETIKKLGFRYIYGQNNIKNISFFADTLKRARVVDIRPEFREQFFPGISINDPRAQLDTVQFLYPEDEAKYRIPDKEVGSENL